MEFQITCDHMPCVCNGSGKVTLSRQDYRDHLRNVMRLNEEKAEIANIAARDGEVFDFCDGSGPVPAHRHVNTRAVLGGWVANTAYVASNAFVGEDARIYGRARVFDSAEIYGFARVYGNARVGGWARVFDDARVFGNAFVYGEASVYGYASIGGTATVHGVSSTNGLRCVEGDFTW